MSDKWQLRRLLFQPAGEIVMRPPPYRACDVEGQLPQVGGVYVFFVGDDAKYCGQADNVYTRVWSHARSVIAQDFRARRARNVHKAMRAVLEAGERIEIWVCAGKDALAVWQPIGITLAAHKAIEDHVIGLLDLPWNIRRRQAVVRAAGMTTATNRMAAALAQLVDETEALCRVYVGQSAPSETWAETSERLIRLDKLVKRVRHLGRAAAQELQ